LFLTLSTILSTGQIFNAASGHDLSNASNPLRPTVLGEDDRHTVVQLAHRLVRAARQGDLASRTSGARWPMDFDPGRLCVARTMASESLERQPDLEDLDRVEVKFGVQAALDSSGLAKAVLLAGKQQITN